MRILKFAVVTALLVLPTASAQAAIQFGAPVDLNFNNVDPLLSNILDVTTINFGTQSGNNGRIAANGTDVGLTGLGVLTPGDTTLVVGHSLIDQVTDVNNVDINPLDSGSSTSFNLTSVLRNVTGEIAVDGSFLLNRFNGGFIDFYLDVDPESAFDASNLMGSVDDTLIASFELIEGDTLFLNGGFANTNLVAGLVSDPFGFFSMDGVADLLDPHSQLLIRLGSLDRVLTNNPTFDNIDNGTGGTNIGPDFNPGLNGLDVISQVDGNTTFAVTPEPTSFIAWTGLTLASILVGRRRR